MDYVLSLTFPIISNDRICEIAVTGHYARIFCEI